MAETFNFSKMTEADGTVMEIARKWLDLSPVATTIQTSDRLLDRPCRLKHVCWKFTDTINELWVDGVLSVRLTVVEPNAAGEPRTQVNVCHRLTDSEIDRESKTAIYKKELPDLARWHLAWLTDANVWIDSATIDMEFDQKLLVEKRKFQVKELRMTVSTNYQTVHGWLLHMDRELESLIYRGNGIMDANKFLQLPFASRLRKLMIIYESSFDDRLLVQLTAEHLQLASDFITDVGINKLLHRWNNMNYPIRSEFVIYVTIKSPKAVIKDLNVIRKIDRDPGVLEYLIQLNNPHHRMRVICRPSSVICTIFAVDNSLAPPPTVTPVVEVEPPVVVYEGSDDSEETIKAPGDDSEGVEATEADSEAPESH